MAADFPALGDAISNVTNVAPAASDYTILFWWRLGTPTPAGGRTAFVLVNGVATYTQYVGFFTVAATTNALIEIGDGGIIGTIPVSSLPTNRWFACAYTRAGTTHSLYVDHALVGTDTADISGATFSEVWMGDDSFANGANHQITQVRQYTRALSYAELLTEWASATAVSSTNLWADTPLVTDFDDVGLNGYDWTPTGTAAISSTYPLPAPAGALLSPAGAPNGVKRLTNNVPASSDYTISFLLWLPQTPSTTYHTAWIALDDPAVYAEYISIYTVPSAAQIALDVWLGPADNVIITIPTLPGQLWVPIAYVRRGTTHEFWYNYALQGSDVLDVSGADFAQTFFGTDTYANSSQALRLQHIREWDRALSGNELLREWAFHQPTAFSPTNLWSDAPMTADFDDVSGHGYDYAAYGAGAIDNTYPMPRLPIPGYARRSISAVATGTTSLSITAPVGIQAGDLLVLCLSHKSSAFATVPALFDLVQRDIEPVSGIRGEMWVKYATGAEPASYLVTVLNDSASGFVACYSGTQNVAGGTVKIVSSIRANAAAVGTGPATDGLNVPIPGALILFMVARSATSANVTFSAATPSATKYSRSDPGLFSITTPWQMGGTSLGTDSAVALNDATKLVPGPMGNDVICATASATGCVVICAAMCPAPSSGGSGTRYYLGLQVPALPRREPWPLSGDWISTFQDGPDVGDQTAFSGLLTQSKTDAGYLFGNKNAELFSTNLQGNADILIRRYLTQPLAAQTLSGTIDVCLGFTIKWLSTLGFTTDSVVSIKIHVAQTVGQTTAIRAVLVDNYVDPHILNNVFPPIWTALTTPQSVATTIIEDDSLVVEIGLRITSSPTPTPTYPPTEYTQCFQVTSGAMNLPVTLGSNGQTVPYHTDGVPGATLPSSAPYEAVPWIRFTDAIVELPLPITPANISPDLAEVLPADAPLSTTVQTVRGSVANGRAVWFVWTPSRTGLAQVTTFGSRGLMSIEAYTATDASDYTTFTRVVPTPDTSSNVGGNSRSLSLNIFEAQAGQTYYLRVYSTFSGMGAVQLNITYREVPLEDDVYTCSGNICVWREGVLVNVSPDLQAFTPSGVAIDYTLAPMQQLAGGTNTNYRLYVALFGSPLVEILDLDTLNLGENEIDYIDDALDLSIGGQTRVLAALQLSRAGLLYVQTFGNGFLYVAGVGTAGAGLPARLSTISDVAVKSAVRGLLNTHADSQPGAPWPAASELLAAPESTAPWHGALDEASGTLYYSSGGHYFAVNPSQTVKRYNVYTQTQLPDFATLPASGFNPGLKGMCVAPGGDSIFVTNGDHVVRLNSSGATVATYYPVTDYPIYLVDCKLTAAGDHLWIYDGSTSDLFKFSLDTGEQVLYVQTWGSLGNGIQMAIFAPTPPEPPPPPGAPGCPTTGFPVDSA